LKKKKLEIQKKYDKKVKDDPELKKKKLEIQKKYDKKAKDDPELKKKKLETKKKYDKKVCDDPELKNKKLAAKRKYDAKKSNFNATKEAIKNETGLTIVCTICNKLKCPDSVKTYKCLDLVPLEFRVLMRTSDAIPSVCYYCKQLLKKGKVPQTNEVSNCFTENRLLNNNKLNHLVDQKIEKFSESIFKLGKIRINVWNGPSNKSRFDYILSQIDGIKSINLEAMTKKYTVNKKIEYCLGYLSLTNLIQLLLKIEVDNILKDGQISEEGSLILTKYYFDQLFEEEKESIMKINRNLNEVMSFANITNIQEVKTVLEDYINICQILVPQIYEETEKTLQIMKDGMASLDTGSKLVNHLIKLVIPFQRLVHLPRGHSYKIKGPSILVTSSVTKTISKLLPQSISDILIPVALKRKLIYQSDYIFEHINSGHVIDLFKLLKFTFQNLHF
jgi:hypothetical protein